MAQIWKERYDERKHHNKMWGTDGIEARETRDGRLVPRYVYFVRVCSFTFELHSIEQIEACLAFYSRKIHPSSREDIGAADQWECQRWYERLPLYLREESKRPKVV